MRFATLALVLTLIPGLAFPQSAQEFTPPPLVPAEPAPTVPNPNAPPPPPIVPGQGTPAPPSYLPGSRPNYLPYGGAQQPLSKEPPGPEVGLMVSEGLFGMLTAAGIIVLPYFLLGILSGDPVIGTLLAALIFGSAPLAVAQTQVSIANGSRNYLAETWPAALAGLVAQAGVFGLTYLFGGGAIVRNNVNCPVGSMLAVPTQCGNDAVLLIGSIVAVPLIQMAVLNIFKQPRMRPPAFAARDPKTGAFSLGVPTPTPLFAPTASGLSVGAGFSLVDFRF